jgi:hypothetical protein
MAVRNSESCSALGLCHALEHPIGSKGFTKAGIRRMIARIHEELAVYDGSEEARQTDG